MIITLIDLAMLFIPKCPYQVPNQNNYLSGDLSDTAKDSTPLKIKSQKVQFLRETSQSLK